MILLEWISAMSWMYTLLVFFVTLLLALHYFKVTRFPPGPFPLPIFGNIIAFKSNKKAEEVVKSWRATYGDIFTVWLGSIPYVVVCSWPFIREALVVKKSDFSGRLGRASEEKSKEGNEGILSCDYGPTWKALRKISQSAVRKYAASERLARIVCDVTDDVVVQMIAEKRSFDPSPLLELTVVNILASSVFGKRYDMDDEEFRQLGGLFQTIIHEFGTGGNIGDFFPFLKFLYREQEKKIIKIGSEVHHFIGKKLKEHLDTYQSGHIRDFTDALLSGREEVQAEGQEKEMKDDNILMAITDIFFAGIQTTHEVLKWTLLLMSNYPQVQDKMRQEILDALGEDGMPVQDDRSRCPFTMAVIMESLRFRPPLSFGIPHKAIRDSQIGPHKIPKDTGVVFLFENPGRDPTLWSDDPEVFRPERFLCQESDRPALLQGFLPFGEGQRRCLGEKMALVDIFLVLCRLCQKCKFELPGGAQSSHLQCENYVNLNNCKPYKVIVTTVK